MAGWSTFDEDWETVVSVEMSETASQSENLPLAVSTPASPHLAAAAVPPEAPPSQPLAAVAPVPLAGLVPGDSGSAHSAPAPKAVATAAQWPWPCPPTLVGGGEPR